MGRSIDLKYARVESLNIHAERSRLTTEQLVRWKGQPVGWFDCGPNLHQSNFFVPRPLLGLLDAGEAQVRFDFGGGVKDYELRSGAMRVYDGHRACRQNDWQCRSARRVMVDLDPARLGEPEALTGLRQDLHFHDDELVGVVRAMVREVSEGCPHGALYAECLSASVLLRLQRTHGRAQRERGTLTAAQLRRVEELIVDGGVSGPTLEALAGATGFSKAHFVRLFRRATGTSPHRYVLLRRLEQARRMIVSSALPLAEVASANGFASQSHLNGAFVRAYRCTPGEARRQARLRVAD
jgi:AraC family transcriptional regulator